MRLALRFAALFAVSMLLLVAHAMLGVLLPVSIVTPHLLLPVAIYLGVSNDVPIVFGIVVAFVLGYLLDTFSGYSISLQTFVMVVTFITARGAGLRLFLRGPIFQIVLTFTVGLLAGLTIVVLRAIFEDLAPMPGGTRWHALVRVLPPAIATAVISPVVFWLVRRAERLALRGREERAVAP